MCALMSDSLLHSREDDVWLCSSRDAFPFASLQTWPAAALSDDLLCQEDITVVGATR